MNTSIKLLAALMLLSLTSCQEEEESIDPEKAFYVKITNNSKTPFEDIKGKFGGFELTTSRLIPGETTDSLLLDESYLADIITLKIDGETYSLEPSFYLVLWEAPIPGRTYNYMLKPGDGFKLDFPFF